MDNGKTEPKKNVGGRPTKYRKWMDQKVIELMSEGQSIEEVCVELDIYKEAFYNWVDRHESFANAVKIGLNKSKAWWLKHGRSELYNKNFQYVLWYMNMKNRFGWSDRQDINIKGEIKDIKVISFSDSQQIEDAEEVKELEG